MFLSFFLVWTVASAFAPASDSVCVSKTLVPQNLSFSRRGASDALASCQTKNVRMNLAGTPVEKQCQRRSETGPRRKVRRSKRCLSMQGTGRHLLQKEHRRKKGRRGQDHRPHRHLRWTRKAPDAGSSVSTSTLHVCGEHGNAFSSRQWRII